jgi:ribonuclease G
VKRQLLLSRSPGELWAALVEDDVLIGLRVWRMGPRGQPGEIFLGRVRAIRPELPAALVDIGLERPGFLSGEDADPRGSIADFHEGQALVVQVIKQARADKATGLSMRWRHGAGRLPEIDPHRILEKAAVPGPVPRLLAAPAGPLELGLEEFATAAHDGIIIDDPAALAEARHWLQRRHPHMVEQLILHRARTPLFEEHGVGEAVAGALMPRVAIAGGGALIIDHAAAATLIDVDTGRVEGRRDAEATALATNLAAAVEVARQIRLRNLAGPIVIDFIGMRRREDRIKVQTALSAALASGGDCEVLGWTRLGHLELVRKRRHAPLAELLFERGPNGGWRKTSLTIALEALRGLAREAQAAPSGRAPRLRVNPEIAATLAGEAETARQELETRLGRAIEVIAEPTYDRETIDIGVP